MNNEVEKSVKELQVELNYIPVLPVGGDRIVVFPIEAEGKTPSGIIIPDTAKEKPQKGMVVAISEEAQLGVTTKKSMLQMGDIILYSKYAGTEVEIPGEKETFITMRETDVFLVVKRKGQEIEFNKQAKQ